VPLVELVGSPWTAPDTIARAKAVYLAIGQVPIVVRREIEGFVLNRLQGALLAEAFRLVGDGLVSPQDLDKTLKDGLGLRWSFMGPFETIELNAPGGIADYCARYTGFYRRLQAQPAGPDVYGDDKVARILGEWGGTPGPDQLAARTAWRDRRLAALRAHKQGQS
jgi:3-hydroxyacyl-CoA dehydrogenase